MRTLLTRAPLPAPACGGAAPLREAPPAGEAVPPGEFASALAGERTTDAASAPRAAHATSRPSAPHAGALGSEPTARSEPAALAARELRTFSAAVIELVGLLRCRTRAAPGGAASELSRSYFKRKPRAGA